LLAAAGVESVIFDQVGPNPTIPTIEAGARLLASHDCDLVIGLGGGSALDAAKAIAFAARNAGDLSDYIYGRLAPGDALPLILVPTTCGTGSEGNGFAVLTDPRTGDKKSLRCDAIIADLSIIDSELMETMPQRVLASVGFDALAHCIEAYLSTTAQPISTAMALDGITLVLESLVPLYRGEGDADLWDRLSWAATLGGMSIGIAGVTVAHGLEHPASGLRDITHGEGLAALTPVVLEKMGERVHDDTTACAKMAVLAERFGLEDPASIPDFLRALLREIGLEVGLGDLGITADDIDWMAENALKVSAPGIAHHPVVFDEDDIKEIYRLAL
jgi:alcohol dehydrogenase class IV